MKMCSANIYICKAQWVVWHNDICLIYDDIVPQKPDI